jgi:hypothetical protein
VFDAGDGVSHVVPIYEGNKTYTSHINIWDFVIWVWNCSCVFCFCFLFVFVYHFISKCNGLQWKFVFRYIFMGNSWQSIVSLINTWQNSWQSIVSFINIWQIADKI